MWIKELAAVGRCLKINRTQRTTTFESLAQICTLWSRHISDSFQLARNDLHCRAHIGIAVKIRCNNDFRVRALSVKAFGQQLQPRALAGGGYISTNDVSCRNLGRVGVGIADFGRGRFGFVGNFTRQRVDGVVRVFGQRIAAVRQCVAALQSRLGSFGRQGVRINRQYFVADGCLMFGGVANIDNIGDTAAVARPNVCGIRQGEALSSQLAAELAKVFFSLTYRQLIDRAARRSADDGGNCAVNGIDGIGAAVDANGLRAVMVGCCHYGYSYFLGFKSGLRSWSGRR